MCAAFWRQVIWTKAIRCLMHVNVATALSGTARDYGRGCWLITYSLLPYLFSRTELGSRVFILFAGLAVKGSGHKTKFSPAEIYWEFGKEISFLLRKRHMRTNFVSVSTSFCPWIWKQCVRIYSHLATKRRKSREPSRRQPRIAALSKH